MVQNESRYYERGFCVAMLIVMAGLPGTGKSTLAHRLAETLPAVILDKDAVRAALFPLSEIEYSTPQDDLCVDVMLRVAGYILAKDSHKHVILDGRTYSRRYQVEAVRAFAQEQGVALALIECICSDETIRRRLARDVAKGLHPAANRDYEMYLSVKDRAEPIVGPKLVVDTDQDLESVVGSCLDTIRDHSPVPPWVL
jgi:adenylylsulfate kinase